MIVRLGVYFGMLATGAFLVTALVAGPEVVHALGIAVGITVAADVIAFNVWKAVRR